MCVCVSVCVKVKTYKCPKSNYARHSACAFALQEIFTIGKVDGFESVEELAQTSSAEASPEVQINPKEDLLCMIHSSGTTGPPKGVMLTHYNIIANCMLLG